MRIITLTQNKTALVDDCDYDYLSQWKWCAHKVRNTFYAAAKTRIGSKWATVHMHQLVAERLGFLHRADHINQNGLDNRRENLRDSTNKQNQENAKLSRANKSGHKGVSWSKQRLKWRAKIQHRGKSIHLGYFDKLEDAVKARKDAEKKYFTHT